MKFQNCNLINFVTDALTDAHMDAHTDKPKAIWPFNFSKVGGIKSQKKRCQSWPPSDKTFRTDPRMDAICENRTLCI